VEWVETTARTLAEAKEQALDQLGVADDDAEFEILEEPRPGLFGRLRGEARVRARVRPTQPRPKVDRRDRKRRGDKAAVGDDAGARDDDAAGDQSDGGADDGPARSQGAAPRASKGTGGRGRGRSSDAARTARPSDAEGGDAGGDAGGEAERDAGGATDAPATTRARAPRRGGRAAADRTSTDEPQGREHREHDEMDAQQVGEEAVSFVEGLVEAFGLTGTTTLTRVDDDLEVRVDGDDLGLLVGPRGQTLQAVQELTRVAAQRRLGDHDTRLRVDVAGYRERRREALSRFAAQVAADVVAEQAPRSLEPMSSADRKVIHDVLSVHEGVVTRSVGEDPQRRIVIEPAPNGQAPAEDAAATPDDDDAESSDPIDA
jgi:spoIIIJ-associated protein